MNQIEEYFKAFYEYQLKMADLQKKQFKHGLLVTGLVFGIAIAFFGFLLFFTLPDFWPWNQ